MIRKQKNKQIAIVEQIVTIIKIRWDKSSCKLQQTYAYKGWVQKSYWKFVVKKILRMATKKKWAENNKIMMEHEPFKVPKFITKKKKKVKKRSTQNNNRDDVMVGPFVKR